MATLLKRARRDSLILLVCGWAVTVMVAFVGFKFSLRTGHPAVWLSFGLATAALVASMTHFVRKELRNRTQDGLDVESAMGALRLRLARELGNTTRFWSLQVLLLLSCLALPWELWRQGMIYPSELAKALATLGALNLLAVWIVYSQVHERRHQQRTAARLEALARKESDAAQP